MFLKPFGKIMKCSIRRSQLSFRSARQCSDRCVKVVESYYLLATRDNSDKLGLRNDHEAGG